MMEETPAGAEYGFEAINPETGLVNLWAVDAGGYLLANTEVIKNTEGYVPPQEKQVYFTEYLPDDDMWKLLLSITVLDKQNGYEYLMDREAEDQFPGLLQYLLAEKAKVDDG